jgi:hypothetical protein
MNYRFSQDSDFKILRLPQIPNSSASAFVSAEIFEDFKIFSKILFSLTAEDLSDFKIFLLKIFPKFSQDFQDSRPF